MVILILIRRPMWKLGIVMNAFALGLAIVAEDESTDFMFLNLLLTIKKWKPIGPDYA